MKKVFFLIFLGFFCTRANNLTSQLANLDINLSQLYKTVPPVSAPEQKVKEEAQQQELKKIEEEISALNSNVQQYIKALENINTLMNKKQYLEVIKPFSEALIMGIEIVNTLQTIKNKISQESFKTMPSIELLNEQIKKVETDVVDKPLNILSTSTAIRTLQAQFANNQDNQDKINEIIDLRATLYHNIRQYISPLFSFGKIEKINRAETAIPPKKINTPEDAIQFLKDINSATWWDDNVEIVIKNFEKFINPLINKIKTEKGFPLQSLKEQLTKLDDILKTLINIKRQLDLVNANPSRAKNEEIELAIERNIQYLSWYTNYISSFLGLDQQQNIDLIINKLNDIVPLPQTEKINEIITLLNDFKTNSNQLDIENNIDQIPLMTRESRQNEIEKEIKAEFQKAHGGNIDNIITALAQQATSLFNLFSKACTLLNSPSILLQKNQKGSEHLNNIFDIKNEFIKNLAILTKSTKSYSDQQNALTFLKFLNFIFKDEIINPHGEFNLTIFFTINDISEDPIKIDFFTVYGIKMPSSIQETKQNINTLTQELKKKYKEYSKIVHPDKAPSGDDHNVQKLYEQVFKTIRLPRLELPEQQTEFITRLFNVKQLIPIMSDLNTEAITTIGYPLEQARSTINRAITKAFQAIEEEQKKKMQIIIRPMS